LSSAPRREPGRTQATLATLLILAPATLRAIDTLFRTARGFVGSVHVIVECLTNRIAGPPLLIGVNRSEESVKAGSCILGAENGVQARTQRKHATVVAIPGVAVKESPRTAMRELTEPDVGEEKEFGQIKCIQ
jgi:hypothetical protein